MVQLRRQIATAQHRLWFKRWLNNVSWCMAAAATLFAMVVLGQRLYDASIPLGWIGVGLGGGALASSLIGTVLKRETALLAAAKLDEAAGLRERLSSGHCCLDSEDPFARAVVADAERLSASLSARQHIRIGVPRQLAVTAGAVLLAALMFLITPGLLNRSRADEGNRDSDFEQTRVAVKRQLETVRDLIQSTPGLEDMANTLADPQEDSDGRLNQAADVRHRAVKKIDKLADAVKKKRGADEYRSAGAVRKMMRGLKVPDSLDPRTQRLARALRKGDFRKAREEIKAIKELLATLKSDEDKELAAKLGSQLDALSKQLEKLARSDRLAQELQQMGIKKEDVARLLRNLTKKDLEQLRKQLQESGLSRQRIQSLTNRLQQQQQAGPFAQKLAQALRQGAQFSDPGQMGEALAGLSLADTQLGELEMLEQQMAELDSAAAALQDAKDRIDKPCSACDGSGRQDGRSCAPCRGSGSVAGRGGMGLTPQSGQGGLAEERHTRVGFKTERGKVHTGRGAIIGRFQFEGEQVKGEVTSELAELFSAAQRDASDRIGRDRLPRQYHQAVKAYFSNAGREFNVDDEENAASTPAAGGTPD